MNKEKYGFALFVMTVLLVSIFIGTVCISIKLDNMEQTIEKIEGRADEIKFDLAGVVFNDEFNYNRLCRIEKKLEENRKKDVDYLSKVAKTTTRNNNLFWKQARRDVEEINEKLDKIIERQAWDNEQWEKFLEEDIRFMEMQLDTILYDQRTFWVNTEKGEK